LKPRTTCAHSGRHTESKTRACAAGARGTRCAGAWHTRRRVGSPPASAGGREAARDAWAHLARIAHEYVVKRKLALRRVHALDRRPDVDRARIGREARKELGTRGGMLGARGRVALGWAKANAHAHATRLLLPLLALRPASDTAVRHEQLGQAGQAGQRLAVFNFLPLRAAFPSRLFIFL
jgi:hypothetical protein